MPSATVNRPRVLAMSMMCEVTGLMALSVPMASMKDLSIFRASSGSCCRYCRLE
ncbi:hypothetical protein D3C81_2117480 [compost metagenome]